MKKVLVSVLIATMVLGLIPLAGISTASASGRASIGNYVQFGSYYGEPILWKVIDFDKDGDPLLYSERILTLKAFDAKGDYHIDIARRSTGSNFWKDSNIRQWLNSSEERINWIQNPPNGNNVWENPYDQEAGFLSNNNFSKEERNVIKTSVIETDYHSVDGQGSYTTDDWVFFLSKSEYDKYREQGLIGARKPTKNAVENSTFLETFLNDGDYLWNWLRSPSSYSYDVHNVYSSGTVHYSYAAHYGSNGVVPALVLNLQSVVIDSGSGTENSPYIIKVLEREKTKEALKETATPTSSKVLVNGTSVEFEAYTINGNNFFRLRDLAQVFDIGVTWDGATNTVEIDTSIGYTE